MLDKPRNGTRKNKKKAPLPTSVLEPESEFPSQIPLIPVSHTTLFPGMVVPLILPEGRLAKTADSVLEKGGYVGVVYTKDPDIVSGTHAGMMSTGVTTEGEDGSQVEIQVPGQAERVASDPSSDFYPFGVAAKILKRINLPDNQVSVLLAGIRRIKIEKLVETSPNFIADVSYLEEGADDDTELEALVRSSVNQFRQISKDHPLISDEVKVALVNIEGAGKLADFMSSVLVRNVEDYQTILAATDVKSRLQHLLLVLRKEQDVQAVQRKIHDDINSKITGAQREYYLSEQLKLIQKELGGFTDTRTRLLDKFKSRLEALKVNTETRENIEEELEKLGSLHEQSSEYSVCINYLDWVTSLPWGVRSDETHDLRRARKVLDEDHYGLKDAKDRILESLAVRKLRKTSEGSIICFVGAPGTGKTSLGKSIAEALNRKFYRFSVGGMRDEAEIKGHRRTYVGALPGKLVQGLKRVGVQNPVFLIDEVDKIGTGWASGGDPASALLEVLDPEQNKEFLDHYLDIPFDFSDVLFVTTANTLDSIPLPLLDRMEVIELHGYSDTEKFHIAKKHLLPRLLKKNGLKKSNVRISDKALRLIIGQYAREGGVRNLEKEIGKICRKVAYRVAMGRADIVKIDDVKSVEKLLGPPPYAPESTLGKGIPGVVTGLAWTSFGGEVMFVESLMVEGKGGMTVTGSLGDVMQESANIAYSVIRHRCEQSDKKGDKEFFENHQFHMHVPAGATPKDGPSAGITLATSLYSLIQKKPLKEGIAMTGELTLSGKVLPVGGIKEKVLAARRANYHTIVLPKENSKDLKELEPELKKGMKFIRVGNIRDVLRHVF